MKIFGREPALWLALLYSTVVMFSGFVLPLSVDQQGTINAIGAAVVGLLTAWVVDKDGLSAAILGFIKAGLALGLAFGLHLTPDKQSMAMAFASALVAMFVRTQVTASVKSIAVLVLVGCLAGSQLACGPPSKKTIQVLDNAARVVINQIDANVSLPDHLLALKVITAEQLPTVRKFIDEARAGAVKAEAFLARALLLEKPSLKSLAPIIADIIAQFRGLNSMVKHELVQRLFGAVEIGLRVLGSYFALQISKARQLGMSDSEICARVGFSYDKGRFDLVANAYDGNRFEEYAAALVGGRSA